MNQEIAVFDAFRYALEGEQAPDIILADEVAQLFIGDFGVYGHSLTRWLPGPGQSCPAIPLAD